MAAYQVLLLNTAVPQIQAAQSGDTYVVPRDIAFSAALTLSAGTANGVPYLNGNQVVTTGSALTFDGTNLSVTSPSTATTFTLSDNGGRLVVLKNSLGATSVAEVGTTTNHDFRVRAGASAAGLNRLILQAGDEIGVMLTYQRTLNIVGAGTAGTNQAISFNGSTPVDTLVTTSAGNVGIGTNAPSSKLQVSGAIRVTGSDSTAVASSGVVRQVGSTMSFVSYGANASTPGGFSLTGLSSDASAGDVRVTIDSSGNLGLGGSAARATTAGTAIFNIFDGTAPVGTLANGISLYSSSGEAYVMDAAGNATLISPHDSETNEWIFKSKHTPTGKVLRIDVERLLRFVNDHFGLDAVKEFVEE